jgi:glutathione S-transferase
MTAPVRSPALTRYRTVRLRRVILYDAARCPYCARARIVLAEKGLGYESVEIDLSDRPAWLYAKNPSGTVPVLEEDGGFVLPESPVIMEYLEERFPEPPLWPADAAERALGRLWIDRFDVRLGTEYYALRRGEQSQLDERLHDLDAALEAQSFLSGREYGLADIGYVPWILRARSNLGVDLEPYEALSAWLERLTERPAIAAELELTAALGR